MEDAHGLGRIEERRSGHDPCRGEALRRSPSSRRQRRGRRSLAVTGYKKLFSAKSEITAGYNPATSSAAAAAPIATRSSDGTSTGVLTASGSGSSKYILFTTAR